jgi:hypothetical protein
MNFWDITLRPLEKMAGAEDPHFFSRTQQAQDMVRKRLM